MERGDINLDWFKYNNCFTTNVNTAYALNEDEVISFNKEFNKESYDREYNGKFESEDIMDNVVADVEYVELESIPCICNKCKYSKNATVIDINHNNKHEELLCDYNDYTKSVNGGKTKCRHFELREGLTKWSYLNMY